MKFPFKVLVDTDRPEFPNECACCGRETGSCMVLPDPGRPKGFPLPEKPLSVPYCTECIAHIQASQWMGTWKLVSVNIGIWGVALPLVAHISGIALAVGPALGVLVYLYSQIKLKPELELQKGCSDTHASVKCIWYKKGTYLFQFKSESFVDKFRELNRKKLTKVE